MRNKLILLPIVLYLGAACDIADSDRCPAGYEWMPSVKACVELDTDTESDTDSETDNPDSGTDGGDEIGLGEECFSSVDCADYEADYCLLNPLAPDDPGYCTYADCDTDDDTCPAPYICCDCTSLGIEDTSCVTATDAETVQAYGCVCSS